MTSDGTSVEPKRRQQVSRMLIKHILSSNRHDFMRLYPVRLYRTQQLYAD